MYFYTKMIDIYASYNQYIYSLPLFTYLCWKLMTCYFNAVNKVLFLSEIWVIFYFYTKGKEIFSYQQGFLNFKIWMVMNYTFWRYMCVYELCKCYLYKTIEYQVNQYIWFWFIHWQRHAHRSTLTTRIVAPLHYISTCAKFEIEAHVPKSNFICFQKL